MNYAQALADLIAPHPTIGPIDYARLAGIDPDPWQSTVLASEAQRIIMCCSRQSGKSSVISIKAMREAENNPNSLTIIGSPSQNQSSELLTKAKGVRAMVYNNTATKGSTNTDKESVLRLTLSNKSRIICVPGKAGTVRGYSAPSLVVIDEAAYCSDDFYRAIMPMLAVSQGKCVLLSTPHAKSGAFYEIWAGAPEWDAGLAAKDQPDAWLKIKVTWRECPRITQAFVDEYRDLYGDYAYRREFECEFLESDFQVFTREEVDGMESPDIAAWAIA